MFDDLPAANHYVIAYSGGLDSTVLLHAFAQYAQHNQLKFHAVHVHHGLSNQADAWQQHCQAVCDAWGVKLVAVNVDAKPAVGESPEAAARAARYQAFADQMNETDCLLTAHHQNDQAETVLLRLLRGSGLQGLAAMPRLREFSHGWLYRPLLNNSREQLLAYAKANNLTWIDDPSNAEIEADRNFIRHEIIPKLKTRWPASNESMARSANLCQQSLQLLNEYIHQDFLCAYDQDNQNLSIDYLRQQSEIKQKHLIRYWLMAHLQGPTSRGLTAGSSVSLLPSEKKLKHIISDLIQAKPDANPIVAWGNVELRRYKNKLWLLKNAGGVFKERTADVPRLDRGIQKSEIPWDLKFDLVLPESLGTLHAKRVKGQGLNLPQDAKVTVLFRQGGERLKPKGRVGSHPLKKLMQEWQIPPWQRDTIPLIYYQDQLTAVVGYAISNDFAVGETQSGVTFQLYR